MTTSENPQVAEGQREALAPLDLRSLFVAGVHFGHPSKRWNPRMEDFIFGKRSRAHIIDLSKTVDALKSAKEFIEDIVSKGGECLMVGTKAQAQAAIKDEAEKVGAMYINQRWLGGMMTNFQTIQARIERLVYLEDAFAKGTVVAQTKRESLMLAAEVERLNKFFGGIKEMAKLPQVLFIVDIEKEKIAVAEARRLGIPIVAIVDTNCDPTEVDHAIPGNDDSVRSITLLTQHITEAIASGKVAARKAQEERLAVEAELEAQESAARAAAQAQAAERAAQAAVEKPSDDPEVEKTKPAATTEIEAGVADAERASEDVKPPTTKSVTKAKTSSKKTAVEKETKPPEKKASKASKAKPVSKNAASTSKVKTTSAKTAPKETTAKTKANTKSDDEKETAVPAAKTTATKKDSK